MLNYDIYFQNFNKLDFSNLVSSDRSSNIGYSNCFYSILIKQKMEMIRSWNRSDETAELRIDTFGLSKSLLKLKGFSSENNFQPTINSRTVLKSYETTKDLKKIIKTSNLSLEDLSIQVASNNSIPPKLFQKLIQTESGYNPKALSSKGAMGLGQLMPKTAVELGLRVEGNVSQGSVWDPESNLDGSAKYLDRLKNLYLSKGVDSDEVWKLAAGAYNAGMGNIQKVIDKMPEDSILKWKNIAEILPEVTGRSSEETIEYVEKIFA